MNIILQIYCFNFAIYKINIINIYPTNEYNKLKFIASDVPLDSFCIIPYIKDDGNYPNKLNVTCDIELPNIFKYSGQSFIIIPIIGTIRAAPLISNNAKNMIRQKT